MKYIDFKTLLRQELKDPEFRKEYVALEPEFRAIRENIRKQAIKRSAKTRATTAFFVS